MLVARDCWSEEEVFFEGEAFFSRLLDAIARARKTVDLETYIFDRDELGTSVLRALREAASRGVTVRLLLDGFGCAHWSYGDLIPLRRAGIQVRFYHPLPWQRAQYRWLNLLTVRRALLGLWRLNRRNHRKTCIIDGESAFAGGMNVSAEHLTWRDTSVGIRGKDVQLLTIAFDQAWSHALGFLRPRVGRAMRASTLVRLNFTQRQRRESYRELLERMVEARARVWVTNPYFIPDLSLIRALRFAAWAGVDVRLLVPQKADVWGIRWAIQAFYRVLLTARVRIYEYRPRVLHAKSVLIDQWALVGSSNLNHRSLLHDLEADIVLKKKPSLEVLEARFLKDLEVSHEIELGKWKRRGLWQRFIEGVAILFKRWI